jgi:hypothetical protein
LAVAAGPAWSAERDALPGRARTVVSDASTPVVADDPAALAEPPEQVAAPPVPDSNPVRRRIRNSAIEARQAEAVVTDLTRPQPARKSGRRSIARIGFQNEADRLLAPMPDVEPPRETGGITLRPFRKINDIVPYDNYEPDPELAAQDRCNNLCPRPKGGDCPDCNPPDSDEGTENGLQCPECPWEQDLRRIGRKSGEPDIAFIPRDFAHIHYCWEPTNLYHNPIYFEDVPLERYGHTRHYIGIQPLFSTAKFALQLVGLPYQMSLFPVWDRQYSLGYYRPGEYVPYKYYQIPLNATAAVVEAGVISGSYFIFAPGVGP